MERIAKTEATTTTSYGIDGITYFTSTVTVHELDDGEEGIHLAGNSSMLDPHQASHMLNVPIIDDDISDTESASTETNHSFSQVHNPLDDNWFPSLSKASWIQDLDKNDGGDEDTLMTDSPMETLFASHVVEMDDGDNNSTAAAAAARCERPNKSRRTSHGPASLDSMDKDYMADDDNGDGNVVISSLENSSGLVPVNVVYGVLND